MRYINRHIPDKEAECELDTVSKIRNLLLFGTPGQGETWYTSLDLASGYHNLWVDKSQWDLMGLAIGENELPPRAVRYLRTKYPFAEHKQSRNFYFIMRALPFGLSSSCAVFLDVVTALAAAWRRHKVCAVPVRLTSYIDDFFSVSAAVRAAGVAASIAAQRAAT